MLSHNCCKHASYGFRVVQHSIFCNKNTYKQRSHQIRVGMMSFGRHALCNLEYQWDQLAGFRNHNCVNQGEFGT